MALSHQTANDEKVKNLEFDINLPIEIEKIEMCPYTL